MAKNIGREAMILKKRRKELGLTQTEVADAIGAVKTDWSDKPLEDQVIETIVITEE